MSFTKMTSKAFPLLTILLLTLHLAKSWYPDTILKAVNTGKGCNDPPPGIPTAEPDDCGVYYSCVMPRGSIDRVFCKTDHVFKYVKPDPATDRDPMAIVSYCVSEPGNSCARKLPQPPAKSESIRFFDDDQKNPVYDKKCPDGDIDKNSKEGYRYYVPEATDK